jgi:chromosome segregation and condensation protein ScpB
MTPPHASGIGSRPQATRLTAMQTVVLATLQAQTGPVTAPALARVARVKPAQASRALGDLRSRQLASLDRVHGENVWTPVR